MKDWYPKLALYFKEHRPKLPIASIDCDKYPIFCHSVEVTMYPEIKIYFKGHSLRYLGKRNFKSLKNWIRQKALNSPTKLDTVEQLQALRNIPAVNITTNEYEKSRGVFIFLGDSKTQGYHYFS